MYCACTEGMILSGTHFSLNIPRPLYRCALEKAMFCKGSEICYVYCLKQVNKKEGRGRIKKGRIGIVEKARETSSDTGICSNVCMGQCCTT